MYRFQWTPEDGIEFQLTYGGWIDVLRGAGFEIERLVELRTPKVRSGTSTTRTGTRSGRASWPAEEIWVARKTG